MLLLLSLGFFGTNGFAPGVHYRAGRSQFVSQGNEHSIVNRATVIGPGVVPRTRTVTYASVISKGSIVEELLNTDELPGIVEIEALQDQQVSLTEEESVQEFHVKLINAALLIACFGYAIYTIVNIDHGMTRGWSQSEIAMRIPLDNWHFYESSLSEKPIETKTTINVIIYLLGDWLSQTLFSKKNVLDFDAKRTLRNGFIGLCFGPLVAMYYEWSDYILPVEAGLWNRVQKIFMDQTLYLSVKCSLYILAVGLLGGEDIKKGLSNVKERIVPIMFTAWKFWPLVHCVTYGAIPARHRILWVNSVDLVWNAILASAARDDPNQPQEEDTAEGINEDNPLEALLAAFKSDTEHAVKEVEVFDENSELTDMTVSEHAFKEVEVFEENSKLTDMTVSTGADSKM